MTLNTESTIQPIADIAQRRQTPIGNIQLIGLEAAQYEQKNGRAMAT